jgi:aminopeptidase N
MMYYMFGEAVFLDGMSRYINGNVFSSVRESDLWEAMQAAVDAAGLAGRFPPIADLMSPWTNQAGFPLVTVTRDYETATATIQQVSTVQLIVGFL